MVDGIERNAQALDKSAADLHDVFRLPATK
jgi:hypothetical protein